MNIVIAGYGFVGTAVAHALGGYHDLLVVDPRYNKNRVYDCDEPDGVIVCVGTPSKGTGDCDISQLMEVLLDIPEGTHVLIKSTVPPDLLRQIENDWPELAITYSPEFLRAASAVDDFKNQTYMILGGAHGRFWETVFRPCLPQCKDYLVTSLATASMVKYAENTFLATKVAFFNQLYDLCDAESVDYNLMRELLVRDSRIGASHTQVPGPDGNRGFGGHCFPKDTEAFVQYARRQQLPFEVLESVVGYNKKLQKSNKK